MKVVPVFVITLCIVISSAIQMNAQENDPPYSAKAYWIELNRDIYRNLKQKEINHEILTGTERQWIEQYEEYLTDYYAFMITAEKDSFNTKKDGWYSEAGLTDLHPNSKVDFRKTSSWRIAHAGLSGTSGLIYGLMINDIFELESPMNTGMPMLLAGGSTLFPLISPRFEEVNINSFFLASHGKIAGGFYGWSLALAIFGENVRDIYIYEGSEVRIEGHRRLSLALALSSSIGFGQLGFHLGKTRNWTEGQAALYQYYGYAIPAFTSACLSATGYSNNRGFGINLLLSAPLGYLAAHKVAGLSDYTRGDINALTGLTALGSMFGFSSILLAEADGDAAILFPAFTGMASSALGHMLLKDIHLSRTEGRRVNYAAMGGALIGLGTAILFEPDNEGWYALLPTLTGLVSFGTMLNYYQKNQTSKLVLKNQPNFNFSIDFFPQNLIFSKLDTKGIIPPLVAASCVF